MSQRTTTFRTAIEARLTTAYVPLRLRGKLLISLVLVLLITNGGAG
jgi:hypothetical protein